MGPSGPRKSPITRRRVEPKPMTTDISEHALDASPDAPDRFVTIEGIRRNTEGHPRRHAGRPPSASAGFRVVSTRERRGSPFAEKLRTLILDQGDSGSDRRRATPRFRPAGRVRRRRDWRPTGSRDDRRSRGNGHDQHTGPCAHSPGPRDGMDGPASTDHGTSVENHERFALPALDARCLVRRSAPHPEGGRGCSAWIESQRSQP